MATPAPTPIPTPTPAPTPSPTPTPTPSPTPPEPDGGDDVAAGGDVGGGGTLLKPTVEPAKPVVPEKYDLKLPEGSPLDKSVVESVSSFAKEKKLSNEQAQAVLEREHDAVVGYVKNQEAQVATMSEQWKQEVLSHPVYGGPKAKETAELARRFLDKHGTPGMKKFAEGAFGNHPDLVITLANAGRLMREDRFVDPSNGGQPPEKSLFARMYPHLPER